MKLFDSFFSQFTTSKKYKKRKNKTRRIKKRYSRRKSMRGGWGEPLPSSKTLKNVFMKGGWGGAVPTNISTQ